MKRERNSERIPERERERDRERERMLTPVSGAYGRVG